MMRAWWALGVGVGAAALSWPLLPRESVLGAYETSLEGRTRNQTHNARLAANELNHATIGPGETFSFNQRLKGWTVRDGYRKAPVSFNGQLIDSWGGGVCQTSTTLYNAALLAGLTVTERNRHRFVPTYVAPGRDAAVAYETVDLKIKNPNRFPVRIEAGLTGSTLSVRIIGAGPAPHVTLKTEVLHRSVPSEKRIRVDRPLRVRNSGKPGFEVRTWRQWPDGRREFIAHDEYDAMDRLVEGP